MDKKGEKLEASEIAERTAQAIIKLLTDTIPNMYHIQPRDIQILAPMRNGSAGTIALNKLAQEALNPEGPSLIRTNRKRIASSGWIIGIWMRRTKRRMKK